MHQCITFKIIVALATVIKSVSFPTFIKKFKVFFPVLGNGPMFGSIRGATNGTAAMETSFGFRGKDGLYVVRSVSLVRPTPYIFPYPSINVLKYPVVKMSKSFPCGQPGDSAANVRYVINGTPCTMSQGST